MKRWYVDLKEPLRIALMETPARFELNSAQVVGRVGEFMASRLQNYKPIVDIIPARKKGSAFSPDDPEILKPLLYANLIFMGPGTKNQRQTAALVDCGYNIVNRILHRASERGLKRRRKDYTIHHKHG